MISVEVWSIARADEGSMIFLRPIDAEGQEALPGMENPAPEYTIPVFIGQLEAQAILIGCGGLETPRPLTHDLFLSVMERAGLVLRRVEITEIRDDTFYARLVIGFKTDEAAFTMDARPSDALSLAVRVKCPILVAEPVLAEAGIPVSDIIDADTGAESSSRRESLRAELDAAVAAENYEHAVELRDMIALMDRELPKT
jgi:bifunctional DNase/RNase